MWPKSPRIRINELGSKKSDKNSPRAPYNKPLIGTQVKKRRPQSYSQRMQKLQGDKDSKETLQLMKIPKAVLLTPSSSDNSLTASLSGEGAPTYIVQPNLTKKDSAPAAAAASRAALPPYLTLKRQQTAAMLSFRARKSLSQMDFKEARRTGNYQLVAHVPNSSALVSTDHHESQLTIKDDNLAQLLLQDAAHLCGSGQSNVRFVVNADQDVRIASLRIFNTIMLRSWRRRREEVRNLNEQVEDFKRNFVKNRNQLHVYNTLFAVEKRRNDTLNDQLRQSYTECAKTKLSFNEVSILLDEITKEKHQLAQENACQKQEIEKLQEQLEATKKDLAQNNSMQQELLKKLTGIQMECQNAKFDIEELTGELMSLRAELDQKEKEVVQMRESISFFADQLEKSGAEMLEFKCETERKVGKLMHYTEKLKLDIKEKEAQVITLQKCLGATVGQRIRQCFAQSQPYQHATFRLMHLVAFSMLPATPPPVIPMSSISGAVNSIRGVFNNNGGNGGSGSSNSAEPDGNPKETGK